MKKILFSVISVLIATQLYSQYNQNLLYEELYNGVELYNGIHTIGDPKKGIIFINKTGKECSKNIQNETRGGIRGGIIYSQNGIFTFLDIVKELENIDEFYLSFHLVKQNRDIKTHPNSTYLVSESNLLLIAQKGEKFAYITKFGDLITDFKYSVDEKGMYRIDSLQNTKLYIDVNEKGKEVYAGELPISYPLFKSQNLNLYIVYDSQYNDYLHHEGYNYSLHNSYIPLKEGLYFGRVLNGCNVISSRRGIFYLKKGKVKYKTVKKYGIITNFHKNKAIAKISNSSNMHRLIIINEKGKVVKLIPEKFNECDNEIDAFGVVPIYSERGKALIDYSGNFVIPYCESCDIFYKTDGIYEIYYYTYSNSKNYIDEEKSGVYNQYGHKILPSDLMDLELIEGTDYNYFLALGCIYILDKDNNLLWTEAQ